MLNILLASFFTLTDLPNIERMYDLGSNAAPVVLECKALLTSFNEHTMEVLPVMPMLVLEDQFIGLALELFQ